MLVLGVDIAARKGGSNCGIALLDAAKLAVLDQPADDLLWARSIDGTDLAAIVGVLADAKAVDAAADKPAGLLVVLEGQFAARVSPDPSAVEKLISARVRFETICTIRRMAWEVLLASSWQAEMLPLLGEAMPTKAHRPRKPKMTRAQAAAAAAKPTQQVLVAAPKMVRDTKAAARLLCSRLYPNAELTGDECDAVLMARCAAWRRR